jgi:hypothetical protein
VLCSTSFNLCRLGELKCSASPPHRTANSLRARTVSAPPSQPVTLATVRAMGLVALANSRSTSRSAKPTAQLPAAKAIEGCQAGSKA